MKNFMIAVVAVLALVACNQQDDGSGVMREIEKADQAEQANLEAPQTLPSGLQIQFKTRGPDQTLPMPSARAMVRVHYEGRFVETSEVFDSSFRRNEPADFPLMAVVPGFREAIMHMRPGDELIATLPPNLGYGAEGSPPRIPPNAALRFRIRLLMFQEPNGPLVGSPQ